MITKNGLPGIYYYLGIMGQGAINKTAPPPSPANTYLSFFFLNGGKMTKLWI